MKRTIRIQAGEVSLLDGNLIYAKAFPDTQVSLDLAKEYYDIVSYLCEDLPHCTILDINGVSYLAKDAREWLSETSNKWKKTVGVALVTKTYTSKIIGNLFLKLNRTEFPVRLFTDYTEAEQWSKNLYNQFRSGTGN